MHNLVLITSEFPYLSGEPFILNELPYLCQRFDEIYIFSINGHRGNIPTRETPPNVRCFPLGNTISNAKYIKYLINGLNKVDKDLRIKDRDIKRIVASLYTRGRATAIAEDIFQLIKQKNLHIDNATIYSFWFAYQAVAAWLLSQMLNSGGAKTFAVSRAHGYDLYWERATGGFLPFQDVSLKKLKWCFPCSEFGTKYLLDKYPWAADKIRTIRLGTIDHGLNPYNGEKTLVTCCNLEPLKRMKLFAESFCEIAREDNTIKWICIGSGEEEDVIKEIVANAGVTNQVSMTGRLSNEEVMKMYQKEGVMFFCNVSTTEGLPVSIMEAMSFGIPVIATDVGGTSELVDNKNGMLIPPDLTKIKLVNILHDALKTRTDKYNIWRIGSREKWKELVSAETNYNIFCSLIS